MNFSTGLMILFLLSGTVCAMEQLSSEELRIQTITECLSHERKNIILIRQLLKRPDNPLVLETEKIIKNESVVQQHLQPFHCSSLFELIDCIDKEYKKAYVSDQEKFGKTSQKLTQARDLVRIAIIAMHPKPSLQDLALRLLDKFAKMFFGEISFP